MANLFGGLHGPCKINCEQKCDVPAGVVLYPVPRPRHAWSDVLCCPREGCERAFLKQPPEAISEECSR